MSEIDETRARLEKWWAQRDPNAPDPNPDPMGLTVPCDGRCESTQPHTRHLAPDWEERATVGFGLGVE